MTSMDRHIARVTEVDVRARRAVLWVAATCRAVDWPDDLPAVGDVYVVRLTPDFAVLEHLCHGNGRAEGDMLRWRRPDARGQTRMDVLRRRHAVRRAVRDVLDADGFLEIDVPLLIRGTTPDANIGSFAVEGMHLATSAEYQIKRMEAGGFDRAYALTQNFRRGDVGRHRNPEFTMLEWARVGASLEDIEHDAERIVRAAHRAAGGDGATLAYQGGTIDLRVPFERLSVAEAVHRATGVTLEDFSAPLLARALAAAEVRAHRLDTNDAPRLFDVLMDAIQPRLGAERPVFVRDWPLFQASSAPVAAGKNVTERSELFIAGVELSDGFPTLTDADRARAAFAAQQSARHRTGLPTVTLDEKYLAMMDAGLPAGAGMALGFDRLVMLVTDQPSLAPVLAFGWDEL